jgi:hypothetical protein
MYRIGSLTLVSNVTLVISPRTDASTRCEATARAGRQQLGWSAVQRASHLCGTGSLILKGNSPMERYLVELTGDQLDRLNGMVREAINAAKDENKRELEDLLSALHDIRWKAGDRRSD